MPANLSPGQFALTAIPFYANANRAPASRRVWIPRSAADAVPGVLADLASPSTSHTNPSDIVGAMNDGLLPKDSADESIPRFTWWDHRGTSEWAQYTFDRPTRLAAVSVYWWDERHVNRHCRVPASWRLVYRTARAIRAPVRGAVGVRHGSRSVESRDLRADRDERDPPQSATPAGVVGRNPGMAPGSARATPATPSSRPAIPPAVPPPRATIRVDARARAGQ